MRELTQKELLVARYLCDLGLTIVFVEELEESGGNCPFGIADLNWTAKILRIEPDAWEDIIWTMIHEAGHALACSTPLECQTAEQEFDFLGWEFTVAKHLGLADAWLQDAGISDYQISEEGRHFSELDPEGQSDLLEERCLRAVALGLISSQGTPLTLR